MLQVQSFAKPYSSDQDHPCTLQPLTTQKRTRAEESNKKRHSLSCRKKKRVYDRHFNSMGVKRHIYESTKNRTYGVHRGYHRIGEAAECRRERDPGGPNLDLPAKYETGLEELARLRLAGL